MKWINQVLCGDNREILQQLPKNSISCVVTSPPYWGLRDYSTEGVVWGGDSACEHEWSEIRTPNTGIDLNSQTHLTKSDKQKTVRGSGFVNYYDRATYSGFCVICGAWKGELGLEPHPDMFVDHLCEVFDEVRRVLRPDGCLWVNLGDTYGGSGKGIGGKNPAKESWNFSKDSQEHINEMSKAVPAKSLAGVPFRFALAMIGRGWILRNNVIWHKKNALPSSAKDRFTVDFEYFFFFTKKPHYWFEQQLEPYSDNSNPDEIYTGQAIKEYDGTGAQDPSERKRRILKSMKDGTGKNKRTVWSINTKSFPEAHFAVFPEELVEVPIKSGCPEQICRKCGKAREVLVEKETIPTRPGNETKFPDVIRPISLKERHVSVILGTSLSDCGCGDKFRPGVVLDPFNGSGTTAVVALKQRKWFVGIDANPEYCELARKRIGKVKKTIASRLQDFS